MRDRSRSRSIQLGWAAVCLVLLALLAVGAHQGWAWEVDPDAHGREAADWARQHTWTHTPLRLIELGLGPYAIVAASALLTLALFLRGHRRAALVTIVVLLVRTLAGPGLKDLVGRPRPPWQWPTPLLNDPSFPSGHASSTGALAGTVIVLALIFLRRQAPRRLVVVLAVLAVIVVDLDRVLLGRHYPSDTVGGNLLGAAIVLLALAVYSPLPRSHARGADPLPEPFRSERRLAVVLNPSKVQDVPAFQALVTSMAAEAGWSPPSWHLTTPQDSGTGQAEQASVEGSDLVIVCGGDGTVREVAAELAGTGIPVGIVPAGTGNLLARNLDIPLFIRAAVDIALTGQDRAIDMVAVRGDSATEPGTEFQSHFMVMAGMGFDAAVMEGVNEDIKRRVGWLAYVLSGLKSMMFPETRVEISVDGGDYTRHRARTIVVGNVGYLQAGMPLLPDATIDDGRLDVVLLYPRRFLSWIPLAIRVMTKHRRTDALVNRMTGRTVSIRAATDAPRQLDGDSIGAGRELHMECIHGRLLVRVPR